MVDDPYSELLPFLMMTCDVMCEKELAKDHDVPPVGVSLNQPPGDLDSCLHSVLSACGVSDPLKDSCFCDVWLSCGLYAPHVPTC